MKHLGKGNLWQTHFSPLRNRQPSGVVVCDYECKSGVKVKRTVCVCSQNYPGKRKFKKKNPLRLPYSHSLETNSSVKWNLASSVECKNDSFGATYSTPLFIILLLRLNLDAHARNWLFKIYRSQIINILVNILWNMILLSGKKNHVTVLLSTKVAEK